MHNNTLNSHKSDKKEIIFKILNDKKSFSIKTFKEISSALDRELLKSNFDCNLIDELTLWSIEINGLKPLNHNADEKLKEFKIIQNKEKHHFFWLKICKELVIVCVMVLLANMAVVSEYGMNIFSFIMEITNPSSQKQEIILPVSENDPYGIIAECEENGISADTPYYLPDDFILTDTEINNNAENYVKIMVFVYENENQRITITCREYLNEVPRIGMASERHNFTEMTFLNGAKAVISREDNQMNFLYNREKFVLSIFTQNVDYSECEKIVKSIK